ncbi:lantibiotic ABC transporter ATP-binding protein [Virgibacillus profundi]|uniref:Lantibiotic ABC transporter ATP-binding protein n=1 Tax=Virgibacillus profundi TaxID=2024555 RepID=A0A2A2II83_9BACI|nr:lantibiotic ABC transporter ATP-binding protein [Virgibacillus profundi]PXY55261.1 ABC transporter ATP-binding protein [Virgibacillus profundi]
MKLKITDISKSYGKKTVLYPTNIDVKTGKCVVICGGNGAGKSTLIKIITGIEKATSGSIRFNTKDKKHFSYMPDHMNFHAELTPVEVLDYYASFIGATKKKIKAVLERVGLWDKRNHKVGSFSKGMTQRVNLAQALLADVDLYILDEPTNGLDPFWVIQFKWILQELIDAGKTVILSSHIMRDVEEISDEIVILFEGKIKTAGTLEEIYSQTGYTSLEEIFLSMVERKVEA